MNLAKLCQRTESLGLHARPATFAFSSLLSRLLPLVLTFNRVHWPAVPNNFHKRKQKSKAGVWCDHFGPSKLLISSFVSLTATSFKIISWICSLYAAFQIGSFSRRFSVFLKVTSTAWWLSGRVDRSPFHRQVAAQWGEQLCLAVTTKVKHPLIFSRSLPSPAISFPPGEHLPHLQPLHWGLQAVSILSHLNYQEGLCLWLQWIRVEYLSSYFWLRLFLCMLLRLFSCSWQGECQIEARPYP